MYILLADNICNESTVLRIILMAKNILNAIKILVPIILIVLGILDITKAVIASDEQKMSEYKNKFVRRTISAVIIFFIPALVDFTFNSIDGLDLKYTECWTAATKENVVKFKSEEQKAKEAEEAAKKEKQKKELEKSKLDEFETNASNQSGSNSSSNSGSSSNSSSGTGSKHTSSKREKIVDYARSFVGKVKYVWGGTSLKTGVDCSGFTQQVYKHFNIDITRTTYTQIKKCKSITRKELRKGDLVFYMNSSGPHHVAIYIGSGKIVHAWCTKCGPVTESKMDYSSDTRKYANCLGD